MSYLTGLAGHFQWNLPALRPIEVSIIDFVLSKNQDKFSPFHLCILSWTLVESDPVCQWCVLFFWDCWLNPINNLVYQLETATRPLESLRRRYLSRFTWPPSWTSFMLPAWKTIFRSIHPPRYGTATKTNGLPMVLLTPCYFICGSRAGFRTWLYEDEREWKTKWLINGSWELNNVMYHLE